ALLHQERQEVDLEEHVAELVEQLGVVAGVGGVGELVGLLDRVGDDRALVLLAIPRALTAQLARELVKSNERAGVVTGALVSAHVLCTSARTTGSSSAQSTSAASAEPSAADRGSSAE